MAADPDHELKWRLVNMHVGGRDRDGMMFQALLDRAVSSVQAQEMMDGPLRVRVGTYRR